MALIKCLECGKEYSDKAQSCPNCGCPTIENIPVNEESKEKSINSFDKIVGYMRRSIEGSDSHIMLKGWKSGNIVIDVNDVDEIRLCKATLTSNGFITICTTDGGGHSVSDAISANSDSNSILFNQPQNKIFESLANNLGEQLSVSVKSEGFMTASESRKKKAQEESDYQRERIDRMKKDGVVFCPKCHSESVTYVSKKLSIGRAFTGAVLAGNAGAILGGQSSKKGINKCMNCGYSWKI